MSHLTLFAYGSNMCPTRLRERAPSARYLGVARLPGHQIRFHKGGSDGSAKADAFPTGRAEDQVWGVLFTCSPEEKPDLDAAEGLGRGYQEVEVRVQARDGRTVSARMYAADPDHLDDELLPFRWYRDYVVAGARHHGLPEAYVRGLEEVDAGSDPDEARRWRNVAVRCRLD